ncbi:MAG: DUF1697 domain-containing protein [Acidobacteria bacterium]|nr:DUF1697 domain-containing protein [Acidobacteriota bacterium]
MPRKSEPPPKVFVALLRGINVGGKNMIRMSALKESFEGMGFGDVTTYINSGNVVFRTQEGDARKLERDIEGVLSKEHGLDCKVVVRSFAEMAGLLKSLPETWDGDPLRKYNVIFLRHSVDDENILNELEPEGEVEQVVYLPGTLLWSARVSDIGRTSFHKLPGRKLFQEMTVRNTNTTRKLYELMKNLAGA